ncbi:MAG: phosphoribosylformylglycinamidine synthase, partial [Candidatus Marinimicrobia bacterium]|nr:phosphoribosylformylglycinamidine synthase [Candidatus Neomarinimicrobiota bacterium]
MPAARLEIALRSGVPDTRGHSVREQARRLLHLPLRACRTREVYLIDFTLTVAERRALRAAFTDPVTARAAYDRLPPPPCDWVLEIGFKPGVTDNVGRTARALTADVLDRQPAPGEEVFTATQYFLSGPGLERDQVLRLASEVLANPLIQTMRCWRRAEWLAAPVDRTPPRFTETPEITARTIPLDGGDAALERISAEGILSLSLTEMHAIRDHYLDPARRAGRAAAGLPPWPTDVELECLAQSWSEHCCHKIFAARVRYTDSEGRTALIDSLFKTYIQGATRAAQRDWLVSVFTDNAGIVRFNERLYLTYKCETHNSPSALDPYGGAITGIVGVNRDPLGTGLGSALLCNTWGYCLGSPFYYGDLPAGLMHPRRIRSGVHQGVIDGGNQSGIPYARGFE